MIPQLGARAITLLRYPTQSYAGGGRYAVGVPASSEIRGSVDPSPRVRAKATPAGMISTWDVEVVSYEEIRAASDSQQITADRLVIDGITYEVQWVDISPPFFGQPQSWVAGAIQVQPITLDPGAIAPPVILALIDGTLAGGATLTAVPVLLSGTPPVTYAYAWTVGGDVVGTSATYTAPDPLPDGYSIFVTITPTGPDGPGTPAQSQPLGAGGGPVDCAVACADTIAAAVAAATAPLQSQIDALIVERDALQVLLDATEAELDAAYATIGGLEAAIAAKDIQIAALQAEVDAIPATVAAAVAAALADVPATWREYTQRTPHAQAGAWSIVGGMLQCVHAGDAETEPNAVSPRTTWRIVDPRGDPAADGLFWGPVQITFGEIPNGGSILVYAHSDPTPGADGLGVLLTRTGAAAANWTRTRMALVGGVWVLNTASTGRATAAATLVSAPAATGLIRVTAQVYETAGLPSTASATELTGGYAIAADAWVQQIRYLTVQVIGAAGTWQARIHAAPGAVLPLGVP